MKNNNVALKLFSLTVVLSMPMNSYASDIILEGDVETNTTFSVQGSDEGGSFLKYLSPFYWLSSSEPVHEEENIETPIQPSLEELLSQHGLTESVIFNVLDVMDYTISFSAFFDQKDRLSKSQQIGDHIISIYKGALFSIRYNRKALLLTALELQKRCEGKNFTKNAELLSVMKGDELLFEAAE